MDYQDKLYIVRDKLRYFENKYHQSWGLFEQQVRTSVEEDFAQWDDYIEWKAYGKMAEEVMPKIEEVKHVHFEIA